MKSLELLLQGILWAVFLKTQVSMGGPICINEKSIVLSQARNDIVGNNDSTIHLILFNEIDDIVQISVFGCSMLHQTVFIFEGMGAKIASKFSWHFMMFEDLMIFGFKTDVINNRLISFYTFKIVDFGAR